MGEPEGFVGCTIKHDLATTTLKIYQPDLITNMTQLFNEDEKSLMNFNTQVTPHKGIVCN